MDENKKRLEQILTEVSTNVKSVGSAMLEIESMLQPSTHLKNEYLCFDCGQTASVDFNVGDVVLHYCKPCATKHEKAGDFEPKPPKEKVNP